MRIRKIVRFLKVCIGIISSLIAAFVLCIAIGAIYITSPWKVINPADPNFDMHDFHITDYASNKELRYALDMLFPIGTPKSYVDEIINGSKTVEVTEFISRYPPDEGKILYQYGHYSAFRQFLPMLALVPGPPPPAYRVIIEYSDDLKLKKIRHVRTIGLHWPFKTQQQISTTNIEKRTF